MARYHVGRLEDAREERLRRHFGITPAFYDWLLAAQGGVCAACRKPETGIVRRSGKVRALAVDHGHDDASAVRGLLCFRCNTEEGRRDLKPSERTRALHRYKLATTSVRMPGLEISTEGPALRMVWGSKAGPGEVSSYEVLSRLQKLKDG
jgi:hypothetical protein